MTNYLEDLQDTSSFESETEFDICPEPVEWIDDFRNEQSLVSPEKKQLIKEKFKRCKYDSKQMEKETIQPLSYYWSGSTADGINLRPGETYRPRTSIDNAIIPHKEVKGIYSPVPLNDVAVHGLIGGRTGSGKSVFLNNLILNLMTEYAPWELELYLADFKKVELSRYASNVNHIAPHIVACAATSNIDYVLSLLDHIVKSMKAREKLFQKLSITHIKSFRKEFNVVLPRILLVVDEFQQMFLESSGKQTMRIQEMLTAITKLGRATGVHLLFASQEMSGTLSGNVLSNFKARFALPCDNGTSSSLIGNTAAGALNGKGVVIANLDGGDANSNIYYKVPLVRDDDVRIDDTLSEWQSLSEFDEALSRLAHLGQGWLMEDQSGNYFPHNKPMKYFDEDAVRQWKQNKDDIESDFSKSIIAEYRNEQYKTFTKTYIEKDATLLESLVLGDPVLYTRKKNDVQTCFLTKGARRHIAIAATSPTNAAYIEKLMLENLINSHQTYFHIVVDFNPILTGVYDLKEDVDKKYLVDDCQPTALELNRLQDSIFTDVFFGSKLLELFEIDEFFKMKDRDMFQTIIDDLMNSLTYLSLVAASPDLHSELSEKLNAIGYSEQIISDWKDIERKLGLENKINYKRAYELLLRICGEEKAFDNEVMRMTPKAFANSVLDLEIFTGENDEIKELKRTKLLEGIVYAFQGAVPDHVQCDQDVQDTIEGLKLGEDNLEFYTRSSIEPSIIIWYRGIESADKAAIKVIDDALKNLFAKRDDIICILTSITAGQDTTTFDTLLKNYTNLRFCKSSIEKVYNVVGMDYSKQQNDESPMFDFKVVNANIQRSFKRFDTELKHEKMHEIDWDLL
ncbi:hypothetical protein BK133_02875 [Paenibacillus sp. FSL H8-0548]|nr:hypothetical protein BK133_02875 [Paenibacillus sp. FSL H8-0548]